MKAYTAYIQSLLVLTLVDSNSYEVRDFTRKVKLHSSSYDKTGFKIEIENNVSGLAYLDYITACFIEKLPHSYAVTFNAKRSTRIMRVSFTGSF